MSDEKQGKCICDNACPMTEDKHWINCPAHQYYNRFVLLSQPHPSIVELLAPFVKLADDANQATLDFLGVGLEGLLPQNTLPVGGQAIRDKCSISLGALVAVRNWSKANA